MTVTAVADLVVRGAAVTAIVAVATVATDRGVSVPPAETTPST